jgi:putative membrane protein insertion efficiency factor
LSHPIENETPDAIDAELLESKTVTPESWLQQVLSIPAAIAILFVRSYQVVLSPLLGRTCRFHPSCSQYYILAVRKYGLCAGTWRGICRISRCHPWNPGGYDPP